MPHHRTAIRHRVRAVGAALGLVSVVTLGGCAGQEPVEPPPLAAPTTATPSATPTPSPSGPPTLPPEARGTSDKAAIAFVRHWVATLNYAADTLDARALTSLNEADCSACMTLSSRVDEVARGGGSIKGMRWTLKQPRGYPAAGGRMVTAVVSFAPSQVQVSPDSELQKFDGGSSFYTFTLVPRRGTWSVREITAESL